MTSRDEAEQLFHRAERCYAAANDPRREESNRKFNMDTAIADLERAHPWLDAHSSRLGRHRLAMYLAKRFQMTGNEEDRQRSLELLRGENPGDRNAASRGLASNDEVLLLRRDAYWGLIPREVNAAAKRHDSDVASVQLLAESLVWGLVYRFSDPVERPVRLSENALNSASIMIELSTKDGALRPGIDMECWRHIQRWLGLREWWDVSAESVWESAARVIELARGSWLWEQSFTAALRAVDESQSPDSGVLAGLAEAVRDEDKARLAHMVWDIRQMPGWEQFALPPGMSAFDLSRKRLGDGEWAVVLLTGKTIEAGLKGAVRAIAVGRTSVEYIDLGDPEALLNALAFWREAYIGCELTRRVETMGLCMASALQILRRSVINPVVGRLAQLGPLKHIYWLPTGELSDLPCEAALIAGEAPSPGTHSAGPDADGDLRGPLRGASSVGSQRHRRGSSTRDEEMLRELQQLVADSHPTPAVDRLCATLTTSQIPVLRAVPTPDHDRGLTRRAIAVDAAHTPGLDALPNARQEAENVARQLARHGYKVLSARDVAAPELLDLIAQHCEVFHFAGHGKSEPQPLDSHLVLDGGALTIAELIEHTDAVSDENPQLLAVLSACDSAKGATESGETVTWANAVGLWGYRNVLASNNPVPDASGARFVTLFYAAFLDDQQSIRDSFRQALQSMSVKYRHPIHWASWTLVHGVEPATVGFPRSASASASG